jgi:hypothetical protein
MAGGLSIELAEINYGPWHALYEGAERAFCGREIPPGYLRYRWDDKPLWLAAQDLQDSTYICKGCIGSRTMRELSGTGT